MRIPATAPPEIQDAFREVWAVLDQLSGTNTNFNQRRLSNVGSPVEPFDVVTLDHLNTKLRALQKAIESVE